MRRTFIVAVPAILLAFSDVPAADAPGVALKTPAEFAGYADELSRSVALFREAGRVLEHPRCVNCHPSDRHPTQGENFRRHMPPIDPGPDNRGTMALPCTSCHGNTNSATLASGTRSIPGTEGWALAPASMAWRGLTIGGICQQLKDPARNGNRDLAKILEHLSKDHLVGWAWHPGEGRAPAPGTQTAFGELIAAWIDSGAHCPEP